MPPKSASAVPPRRPFRTTPVNSIHNFDSTTKVHFPPSSTAAAMPQIPSPSTAVTASSESSQRIEPIRAPIRASNSESVIRIPPHATTPTSQSQSQSSQKTLAPSGDHIKYEESRESFVENCKPERTIHVQAATVVGTGDGSSNLQSEESAAIGVAASGNGKRKVIRKTVRIVKKVIKRRVPKRVLTCSENKGGAVKAEENGDNLSKVTDNLDLANDMIEKSNVLDEVVEKTSVVNEANEELSDDVKEKSHLVNEKSDHVDRVTEKTSIVDEAMEKENITNEVMQEMEIGNPTNISEPIIDKYMESDRSKLNHTANSSEKMVLVNELIGIHTMEIDTIESNDAVSEVDGNDLTIHAPDVMEVEKVNNVSETSVKSKEVENSKMENQSEDLIVETEKVDIVNKVDVELLSGQNVQSEDLIVETENIDIVDKVDVELLSGQNVGPVGEKGEGTICKAESASEVDSDHIRLTEGLLSSGEMEALEQRKTGKTEIFVGGLNRDAQEDDIRNVFGEAGVILEIRLVMSNSGKNRGYAFVRFATAADAKNALEKYSKVEICGKQCNVAPVEGNNTIFLSNLDRNWKAEDVVTLLEKAGIEKIDKVTLKADPNNIEKNRGFAFVEFQTCKDAQTALNKLQKKDVFGKKQMVNAAWAQPFDEPAEEEILQVKSVFAEYLPSSWDKEKVNDYFKRFGEIESVALAKDLASSRRKDFAFINYTTRDAALACIEAVNREKVEDGCSKVKMAVYLAKPVSKRKQMKHTSSSSKQLFEANQKTFETSKNQHELRNEGMAARSSYNHVKAEKRSSTTDELVQILRQQASNKHILAHPTTGIDIPAHHFLLPGSKRTFSQSGHDPRSVEHQDFSRLRVESSYPISGPRSSSHGVGMLSFPYHHRQVPGFTSESVNERRTYPSHFQTRGDARFHADNNLHRRCE